MTLTSNTAGTYIFNTTSGVKTPTGKNTSYSIANGQKSITVYYGDSVTGTPTITAATTRIRLRHPTGDNHRGAHQVGFHDPFGDR